MDLSRDLDKSSAECVRPHGAFAEDSQCFKANTARV